MRYYYDLHIHSCLSPCGGDDSTPDSIAGMGELNGLDIMALTDHNTAKNCPAFFKAAERHGIIPVAGMELTTAEDIHAVCLFGSLEGAMEFDRLIESRRVLVENRPDIFGMQVMCDDADNPIGTEKFLLTNATTVSLDEAPALAERFGGVCFPAHIDRQANGIIAVLGVFPDSPAFTCAELHDREKAAKYAPLCGKAGKRLIISSDAHYIWDIKEKTDFIELKCERRDAAVQLIRYLRGEL